MNSPSKFLLLIAVAAHMSGCAFLYTFESDLDKRVDTWIANHEYATALATLDHVRPSHPQYTLLQKKKQQVLALQKQQQEELARREQHLKTIYYQLYINKAEWLAKNSRLTRDLERAGLEDSDLAEVLADNSGESILVYRELIRCGQEMMKTSQLRLAEQCFSMAQQLNPDDKFLPAIASLRQQLSDLEKDRASQLSRQGGELLASSQQALQKDDIKQAHKLYRQIPSQDLQNNEVRQYKHELDKRIIAKMTQGIEMGRKLYSQGDVERALAVWNDLRQLDPKNEQLTSHIERAQRVLNKLKRLQKTEPVIAPPTSKKDKS